MSTPAPDPDRGPPGRLSAVLARLRGSASAGVLIGLLCGLLGFGIAVQVRSNQSAPLASTRQEDLVRILDELSAREDRLRNEINTLQADRARIASGDASNAALDDVRTRVRELEVLAGTAPAHGPGVIMRIDEGGTHIPAEVLLDALEELRGAGAEAVQFSGAGGTVRVAAQTWFADDAAGITVEGTPLRPPYVFAVIGDPPTLAAAVSIPGGVVDTVRQAGGSTSIEQRNQVAVSTLRPLATPQYAHPLK